MTDNTFGNGLATAMRSEGPVTLLVTARVQERGWDKVRTALKDVIQSSRREKGCLEYDVYEAETRHNEIMFYERWASGADLAAHQQQDFMAQFAEVAMPHLDGVMRLEILRSISDR